jgi:hypothetical protein
MASQVHAVAFSVPVRSFLPSPSPPSTPYLKTATQATIVKSNRNRLSLETFSKPKSNKADLKHDTITHRRRGEMGCLTVLGVAPGPRGVGSGDCGARWFLVLGRIRGARLGRWVRRLEQASGSWSSVARVSKHGGEIQASRWLV